MQLDYIFFFYGLGFILLAGVCYALSRGQCTRLPWIWLGAFAAVHGLNEWIEMLGLLVRTGPIFAQIQLCVLVLSFVLLFEFARRSPPRLNETRTGLPVYLPITAFIVLCGLVLGPKGVDIAARYSLCFTGGILSAAALLRVSRTVTQQSRPWMTFAGITIACCAVTSGVLVPSAPFFPASSINAGWFAGTFGFPIQLLRGILACSMASVLWVYYQTLCPTQAGRTDGLRRVALTLLTMAAVLAAGWFGTNNLSNRANEEFRCGIRCETLTAAAALEPSPIAQLTGAKKDIGTRACSLVTKELARIMGVGCKEGTYFHGVSIIGKRKGRLVRLAPAFDSPARVSESSDKLDSASISVLLNGRETYIGPAQPDQDDEVVDAYAAISDEATGKVVGVLEFGVGSNEWQTAVKRDRLSGILVTLLLSVIAIMWSISTQGGRSAAERLWVSERKYRSLAESSMTVMALFDAEGRFSSVNEAGVKGLGAPESELMGRGFSDVWPNDLKNTIDAAVAAALGGYGRSFEADMPMADGRQTTYHVVLNPIRDSSADVVGFVGTMTDITERRRAERELAWEAQTNSAMADLSSAILSANSLDYISELVLMHAKTITNSDAGVVGYIDPQINCFVLPTVGDDPLDKLHPLNAGDDRGDDHNAQLWMLRDRSPFLSNYLSDSPEPPKLPWLGSPIERIVSVPAMLDDELVGRIVVANASRDYSDRDLSCLERLSYLYAIAIRRRRTESELRIQSSAVRSSSEQIVITDTQGRILYVNPAFEAETGYTFDEVVGQTPRIQKSGKHGDDFYRKMWSTIMAGETWRGEITNRRKDGSHVVEEMTITPVKDEHGHPEQFIAIKGNITELKVYEEQLDYLSYHDPLTGLPNRLLFSDRLNHRLSESRKEGKMLAVMFLDVDRFKLINDTLGHNIGDMLLTGIAGRLHSCLRDVDTIARMGGDEFTIIVSNIASQDSVVVVADRIVEAMKEPFQVDGRELFASVSVGISVYPSDGDDAETLVKNADAAMYRAKERGRSNCQLFTEAFNTADLERMTLENGLRKAVERDELLLHYQPLVDMRTGRTMGTEALVRWQHPDYGLVSPGRFIPLAEETGLIVPISRWVLRTACAQNKAWQEKGRLPAAVSVNLSARLLHEDGLVDMVSEILAETGLDHRYLELELTESALMENADTAIRVLGELKNLGVRVSLDDFGTGYSSLSYLKKFPIDSVKIDQSFVKDITTNPDDAAIASAVVAMSHSLKLKVIAEGVETLEQLEFLKSLDCDEVQGYFISRPVPAAELEQLLEESPIILRVDSFKRAA